MQKPTGKQAKDAQHKAGVYIDRNRHTCIKIDQRGMEVHFIPMESNGLDVYQLKIDEFAERYTPLADYPVERAAKLFAEYSQHLGATQQAMQHLANMCIISDKEIQMALKKAADTAAAKEANAKSKAAAAPKPAAAKPAAAKPAATKPAAAKPAAAKPAAAKPAAAKPAAAKATGEKRETASAMFCELIMAGKLTDDQIFAKVREKFGLDEKKRGYVKWYRNNLRKQGQNPPDAK